MQSEEEMEPFQSQQSLSHHDMQKSSKDIYEFSSPGSIEIHHQLIDMYILESKDNSILSIKDVTIVPPKDGRTVLDFVIGYAITYTCEISTSHGKRRLTSRRDSEIVRAKKAFLKKHLHSQNNKNKSFESMDDSYQKMKTKEDYEKKIQMIYDILPSEESSSYSSSDETTADESTSDFQQKSQQLQQNETISGSMNNDDTLEEEGFMPSEDNRSNWVKCDKCKIWRLLPSTVDLKTLENESWYCYMNKWDTKHNTCFMDGMVEEGKARYRAKLLYSIGHDIAKYDCNPDEMSLIQCTFCYKLRPIPKCAKKPKNFVCPMNYWHYLLASCSAPQLNLPQLRKILTLEEKEDTFHRKHRKVEEVEVPVSGNKVAKSKTKTVVLKKKKKTKKASATTTGTALTTTTTN